MKKQPVDRTIVLAVVLAITILQLGAMIYGVNHTFRTYSVGILGLIAGITLPQWRKK